MSKLYIGLLAILFITPIVVLAHPGNTASDGMHYCWTNCAKWGEVYGERHGHGGSGYTSTYSDTYYSSPVISTPTCPLNSYASGSSCKCNFGYVVSGGSCISGDGYCMGEIGIMSTYDSLTNSCKCMSGYEIGLSGTCTYKSEYFGSYYSSGYTSSISAPTCPAHSTESKTDATKCTCDVGYDVNKAKTKCVKISRKTNDKTCQAEFGTKSNWNGKYNDEGTPYCGCKKNHEWNDSATSCVKSE